MKKLALVFCVVIMLVTVTGCGAKKGDFKGTEKSSEYSGSSGDNSGYSGETVEGVEFGSYMEDNTASPEENYETGTEEGFGTSTTTDFTTSSKEAETSGTKNESADSMNSTKTSGASSNRKLIQTINLTLETLEFDPYISYLEERVASMGGYIESSSISSHSYSSKSLKYADYTIRIPGDKLSAFLNAIGKEANIIDKSSSTSDVTMSYYESESRKKALEIQQDRLFAILEKAETLEDIIMLEERISELTYELEEQGTILKNYDNLVSFSTVNMSIEEVIEVTKAEPTPTPKPKTVSEKMKHGLSETLDDIKTSFENFAIYIVTNLPYVIFWLTVIIIAVVAVLKKRKSIMKRSLDGIPSEQNITKENHLNDNNEKQE